MHRQLDGRSLAQFAMRIGESDTGRYTTPMFRGLRAVRHGVVAAVLVIGAGPALSPIQAQAPPEVPTVSVTLAPEHEHYRPRIEAAARRSVTRYSEWLGPRSGATLDIDDGSTGAGPDGEKPRITVSLPWIAPPPAMEVESLVAFEIARRWWPGWAAGRQSQPMADGLAWYLQSRVVPELYELTFQRPAHSADAVRYFGGAIAWSIPSLALGRWTAGLGRAEFLDGTGVGRWPGRPRRIPADADPMTARAALAFGTLERLVGWPALEGALATLGTRAVSGAMTTAEAGRILSAATGYPLSWFLAPALDPTRHFIYALGAVSTRACDAGPCLRTEVEVINRGTAAFSGTDTPPAGAYGSGDALELRVTFADGQSVSARWDGRAASKTFAFDSAVPAQAIELDPSRVLLLDRNHLDNAWLARPRTGVPFAKWIAWWLIWVQDAAISYSGLI